MCFKALIELVGLGVIRVGLGLIYGVVRATVHMLYKYIIDELTGPSEPRSLDGSSWMPEPRSLDGSTWMLEQRSLDRST